MVKIIRKEEEKRCIQAGDVFVLSDESALMLVDLSKGDDESEQFGLLDLGDFSWARRNLKNICHVINHIKKYYGFFEVVQKDDVEVVLKI